MPMDLITITFVVDHIPRRESLKGPSKDPSIPLLLWVDDNPHNNPEAIRYAEQLGVHVVSVTSTTAAKEWIDANAGGLAPTSFHFITDEDLDDVSYSLPPCE
jgi:hypothetical protein